MLRRIGNYARSSGLAILGGGVLGAAATSFVALAQDAKPTAERSVLFSTPLPDVPGKSLVVVPLKWGPSARSTRVDHRHPGSVYVYVTEGTVRLGIEGQPVREVRAGESFFEPPGALHTVAESASATEPAAAIAVMIVPDGAPLVTRDPRPDAR